MLKGFYVCNLYDLKKCDICDADESTLKVSILGQIKACCMLHIGRQWCIQNSDASNARQFELLPYGPSIPHVDVLLMHVSWIHLRGIHIAFTCPCKTPRHGKEVSWVWQNMRAATYSTEFLVVVPLLSKCQYGWQNLHWLRMETNCNQLQWQCHISKSNDWLNWNYSKYSQRGTILMRFGKGPTWQKWTCHSSQGWGRSDKQSIWCGGGWGQAKGLCGELWL